VQRALILQPLTCGGAGPAAHERTAVSVPPGRPWVVGRSSQADVRLDDPQVSRRHALLEAFRGAWYVTDLRSRAGIRVDGHRIEAGVPARLCDGDVVEVAPWAFRARIGPDRAAAALLADDDLSGRLTQVSLHPESGDLPAALAASMLDRLAHACAADDERSLTAAILDALIKAGGYGRAVLLSSSGAVRGAERVEIVAGRSVHGSDPPQIRAALLRASLDSGCAVGWLQSERWSAFGQPPGESEAVCATVADGRTVLGFLYADAQGREELPGSRGAAVCHAVASFAGPAWVQARRRDLIRREKARSDALAAVRTARGAIAAPAAEEGSVAAGTAGDLGFAWDCLPGTVSAGDFAGVVPLAEGRLGVFAGDVGSDGPAAAARVGMVVGHVQAALVAEPDPARIAAGLAAMLMAASRPALPVWIGVVEPGRVVCVDAGFGRWFIHPRAGDDRPPAQLPLGIDPAPPGPAEARLDPGETLVLFSDGLADAPALNGEPFGPDGVVRALSEADEPGRKVEAVLRAMADHAAPVGPRDDATVVCIQHARRG
jgi:hypothetical protein